MAALVAVHAAGYVHNDISPANIMRDAKGVTKLIDFEASFAPFFVDESNPPPSMWYGTPGYISPEKDRRQSTISFASDIWSVGVLLLDYVGSPLLRPVGIQSLSGFCWRRILEVFEIVKDHFSQWPNSDRKREVDLVGALLAVEPSCRLNAAEVADAIDGLALAP
jgi:serine/threonine protein kinase